MAWYVGVVIFLAIFIHFVLARELMVGSFLSAGSAPAVPVAQYWLKREKTVPTNRRVWIYALICGVVSTILLFVLVAAGLLGNDAWWELYLALALVFNIFGTRLFFGTVFSNQQSA